MIPEQETQLKKYLRGYCKNCRSSTFILTHTGCRFCDGMHAQGESVSIAKLQVLSSLARALKRRR